ncbi:putative helicase mot1, partial [Nosema granulosis]
MNKLEKFFNTLHNSQSRVLKKYTTQELVGQIKEYVDYTPYICKNIYRLLISQSSEDRVNGASILKSIMFQFRLATDFKIEYTDNKDEYFSCTGEEFVAEPKRSVKEQTRLVKAMADLEHVDVKIVNEIDFKAHTEFKIKKQKVKDKEIENIFDFFENLTANLLNYEWNKRHGAFLAYTAMFSQAWNGDREIKVDSTLFMKIYEILKNDKFNDFVEDKTTAPVREAAAELLACIYPRIPVREETILDELYRFLQDADWQTQYSGLVALRSLRKYIKKKRELCSLLESLLVDSDEDVKFLSADLLSSLVEYCDRERVGEKCWENIKDEEEIAVSKTSIIQLLSLTGYKIEENIEYLFPCFSSPVVEVRKSVLEMVRGIENESIDFLVAESILLDEKEEVRELAVGVLRGKSLSKNFLNHFMRILSQSLYEPYSHNDFVSYDELMFTKSGVKLIGEDTILKNRIRLFEVMKDSSGSSSMKEDTAIGMVFNILYKLFSKDSKEGTTKRFKEVEDLEVEDLEVENLYKKCKDLRLLPLKELRNIISSTTNNIASSTTIHPMGDPIYRDYLRLRTLLEFPKVGIEIFKKETCVDFLRIYSNLLFEHKRELEIDLFIEEAYSKLVEGDEYDNLRIFFRVFGYEAISRMRFTATSGIPSSRLVFFGKTLEIYRENFGELGSLFEEAYKARYFPVLKEFVKDLKYGEEFVNKILEDEDLDLLSGVIEELDHSFYPLFIKPLLRRMSSSTSSKLDIGTTGTTTIGTSGTTGTTTLGTSGTTTIGTTTLATSGTFSYIVPRLTFEINRNISKDFSKKILKAKESLEALLDISKVPEYTCRCPTSLVLRGYQVEGVKWISFLFSFNLNGILADDMGLGKTIQVLYFVCSEIYQTNKQVLVLCPSSLTGHWVSEVQRHFPQVSVSLYKKKSTTATSITVVSYDMFRNDYQNFTTREWFYVVLDEGHVLRNPNTLLYSRICLLRSPHKLILTGTPVHNSLDDLVSIFHFIMPNYLSKDDIHKTTTKTTTTKTTTK